MPTILLLDSSLSTARIVFGNAEISQVSLRDVIKQSIFLICGLFLNITAALLFLSMTNQGTMTYEEIAIVSFSSTVEIVTAFTRDSSIIKNAM
jgi:hypothetical protein